MIYIGFVPGPVKADPIQPRGVAGNNGYQNLRNGNETSPLTEADDIAFWLVCATYRCKQCGDHDRYEGLVHRYGDPHHPLVRYPRAYLYDDGDGLTKCAPDAVAWLRVHGQDCPADLAETGGVAAGLMNTGQLGELLRVVTGQTGSG